MLLFGNKNIKNYMSPAFFYEFFSKSLMDLMGIRLLCCCPLINCKIER